MWSLAIMPCVVEVVGTITVKRAFGGDKDTICSRGD